MIQIRRKIDLVGKGLERSARRARPRARFLA
jgi:hypothetical protein